MNPVIAGRVTAEVNRCGHPESLLVLPRIAKNDDQLGLTGEMNNPSPCLRIRTSLTSAGKRNSCGSRTAWLAPLRNMDARLATALDIDLAAAFDVSNFLFPIRARFIELAYGKVKVRFLAIRRRLSAVFFPTDFLTVFGKSPARGFRLSSKRRVCAAIKRSLATQSNIGNTINSDTGIRALHGQDEREPARGIGSASVS
jgi:hypothetical protein